jgi:hypothetical protein
MFGLKKYKIILFLTVLYLLSSTNGIGQEDVEKIKVKKENPFVRAEFDETNYKVIALDKYGNPHENVVKSFVVTFQDTKGHYKTAIVGNTFPDKTIKYLKKREKVTNLCLREIVAEDSEGHIQNVPDKCGVLIYPDCKNCDPNKKKSKN